MATIKTWFWALISVLVLVLIFNVVFFVMPMIARLEASFPSARTLTVSAEGKTTASPNIAQLSFSVVTQGADASTITASNTDKMNTALSFVRANNIADADITTTDYNLSPNYQYDPKTGKNSIDGYSITQTVQVKIRDLSKVSAVLGGLTPLGINQIGGITFTFDNEDTFLSAARADAFSKAQAKAQDIASKSGVSLGRVIAVSENGSTPPGPIYYASAGSGKALDAAVPPTPTIQPGSQDLTDDVTITYELR